MVNHKPQGTYKGRVTNIEYKAEIREGFSLSKISFGEAYYAMEKADTFKPVSQFSIGDDYQYKVTNEGRGAKPDWIMCIGKVIGNSPSNQTEVVPPAPHMRECTMVMQAAWTCAVHAVFAQASNLEIEDGATAEMLFDGKLEKCKMVAHFIGESILESAKELCNKQQ